MPTGVISVCHIVDPKIPIVFTVVDKRVKTEYFAVSVVSVFLVEVDIVLFYFVRRHKFTLAGAW